MSDKDQQDISIIVPIYNAEKYIELTMISIARQSFQNFEVILVDDGSTDGSLKAAQQVLCREHVRYKTIRQNNCGLSAARNTGIKHASGRYVCFIDADDYIDRNHLKVLFELISKRKMVLCFTGFEPTGMKNRAGDLCPAVKPKILKAAYIQDKFLKRQIKIHCCSIMADKDYLYRHRLFFQENLRFGEDVEYLWRFLSLVKYAGYVPAASYKYLLRENSLTSSQETERILFFFDAFARSVGQMDLPEDYKKLVIARVSFGIIHSFAKNSSYELFVRLSRQTDMKSRLADLEKIRDIRVVAMKWILLICPRMFWKISKYV